MRNVVKAGAVLLVTAVVAFGHATVRATPPEPEKVVQAQLEAYNAHNLEAFVATYAEDVQLFEHPSKLLATGRAQLRERYAGRFSDSILHADIAKRIVMGNTVVDHEKVRRTFPEGVGTIEAVAIYEVQGEKIVKTWLIYGPKALDPKP
jgi:hypothetical protein